MIVTFGVSYAGKVDRVPGQCYVVTRVFQVINVPLIPLGGYLVQEGTEEQTFVSGLQAFEGKPIELSWKSFAWAWARAILFSGGLLGAIGVLTYMIGFRSSAGVLASYPIGIAMLIVCWRTRRGLLARPERAAELGVRLHAADLPQARVVR
jgi:hypothetical protein